MRRMILLLMVLFAVGTLISAGPALGEEFRLPVSGVSSLAGMGITLGQPRGQSAGEMIGGMLGSVGGYALAKDSSTFVKIGAGMVGASIGRAVGKGISEAITGRKSPRGKIRIPFGTESVRDDFRFGLSLREGGPMATATWRF